MMVATVHGRFTGLQGTINFDESNIGASTVDVEIDASTVNTSVEQRDNHLRSGDFFSVEQHPTLSFKSNKVTPKNDEEFTVEGELTIRGTTRPQTLTVTYNGRGKTPYGKDVIGFSAETTINRKDFDLNWNVALETGGFLVGDRIKVTLEIEAVK
jgi:polyisoprenoid-binding protein YceI